jgi:hypothetical protein
MDLYEQITGGLENLADSVACGDMTPEVAAALVGERIVQRVMWHFAAAPDFWPFEWDVCNWDPAYEALSDSQRVLELILAGKPYEARVMELELAGLCTSDAQGVADVEFKAVRA